MGSVEPEMKKKGTCWKGGARLSLTRRESPSILGTTISETIAAGGEVLARRASCAVLPSEYDVTANPAAPSRSSDMASAAESPSTSVSFGPPGNVSRRCTYFVSRSTLKKASTTAGSYCLPERSWRDCMAAASSGFVASARAWSRATATMRAATGIAVPARPEGRPPPSQRSSTERSTAASG